MLAAGSPQWRLLRFAGTVGAFVCFIKWVRALGKLQHAGTAAPNDPILLGATHRSVGHAMLFPLPRLWDKAPLAATDNRPPAGEVNGGGAGTPLFLRLIKFCR